MIYLEKLSKIINVMLYSFMIIAILLIIFVQFIGIDKSALPIRFGYVYSGSMEPTIMTNDGYILVKAQGYTVGDIITFRPKVLRDNLVTHRIIEVMEDHTYKTQGDNNPSTDQEAGEPLISKEQILGKALTVMGKPIIIPKLGTLYEKFNAFIFISIIIGVYLVGYIVSSFTKRKHTKHKRIRMVYIAPFFDRVFITFCALLFLNALFIGTTIKSWIPDQISYVVVSTKGLPSPNPGQIFTKIINLENTSALPFVTYLEPENHSIEITPPKLSLSSNQHNEYSASIVAPQKVGLYVEKIDRISYPDVLPDRWLDYMYSINRWIPLIVIFLPGLLLNIGFYIWWLKRSQLGRRKVMEWLIPLRKHLRG